MEKQFVCKECKKEFTAKVSPKYTRKYCDECSAERKKDYQNIHTIKFDDCDD